MYLNEAIQHLENNGSRLSIPNSQLLDWLKELRERRLEALHTVSDEEVKRLWEDYKARRMAET